MELKQVFSRSQPSVWKFITCNTFKHEVNFFCQLKVMLEYLIALFIILGFCVDVIQIQKILVK